jgi:hypothetical protein
MYAQRKKERRGFSGKTSFPLVTDGGYEVEKDRCCTPDQRLGDILSSPENLYNPFPLLKHY